MAEIIRVPTEQERADFQNIGFKEDVAKAKFETELANEFQKAMKKEMPFADKAARADWKEYYEQQTQLSLKKNGYVDLNDIKPLKVNWANYHDLKNFELLDEGETADANLTKHNPGLDVQIAWKKYRFKGYFHAYTVMESATNAILRARKKLKELEEGSKPREKK